MEKPVVERSEPDPVIQFSIFSENKVGKLSDLFRLFAEGGVHVMALSTLETADSAVLRMVLDDPDKARQLLDDRGVPYAETPVLAVELAGERDIDGVLVALLEAEINIHYLYAFFSRPLGRSALVAGLEDVELAAEALNRRNHKVLGQRDISR